jgi:hypothetical protein
MRRMMAGLMLVVALAGCGTDGETASETTASSKAETTTTKAEETTTEVKETTTTTEPSRCEEVAAEGQETITGGLEDLVDVTFSDWAAVRSEDYEEVWFIAAKSSGDGSVAVWSSNALDGSGMIAAVNNTAQFLTVWPDNGGGSSMEDDGAAEAEACVGS